MRDDESDLAMQLRGFRLTTVDVLYYMPGHPGLLQSFMWQTWDQAPRYPRLTRFLDHWRAEIEAVIHSVRVAHTGVIAPAKWRGVDLEMRLN